jgi:hypothetical protein
MAKPAIVNPLLTRAALPLLCSPTVIGAAAAKVGDRR